MDAPLNAFAASQNAYFFGEERAHDEPVDVANRLKRRIDELESDSTSSTPLAAFAPLLQPVAARVLTDDEARKHKRARFHAVTHDDMSDELRAQRDDRDPLNGRFSEIKLDAYDKQCAGTPLRTQAEKDAAEASGRALWEERRRAQFAQWDTNNAMDVDAGASPPVDASADRMWEDLVGAFDRVALRSEEAQSVYTRAQLCTDPSLRARVC
ncbi:MAG: hypothetical protein Q7V62_17020, partial [Actinomycetota bacterium]|nr:hypothetical protein [Actinomycetota bacterium]